MEWKNNVVNEFLTSMDIHNITTENNNFYTIEFDTGLEFHLDILEQGVLLTMMSATIAEQESYIYNNILEYAYYKNNYKYAIQASVSYENKLAISIFLEDDKFNYQGIEFVIDYLKDMFNKFVV
jgi:hypothetical protein